MNYEYCVMHKAFPDAPHRGPWPEATCYEWIDEAVADGFKDDVFYVGRREVGPWGPYDG